MDIGSGYTDLIGRLSTLDPPMFVFGGFAEEALLEGTLQRPHGDVDVIVRRNELDARLRQVEELGFAPLGVYYEPRPGLPLVMGGSGNGLNLELGIVDEGTSGFYFVTGDADGEPHRFDLTDDLFLHPPLTIEATTIHVASPRALFQIREAFAKAETFGPLRTTDVEVLTRLAKLLANG